MGESSSDDRNRHFRCLWSSKGGKQAILQATDRFYAMSPNPLQQQFLDSLVCNVDTSAQLLCVRPTKIAHDVRFA